MARQRRSRRRVSAWAIAVAVVLLGALSAVWLISRPAPDRHHDYVTALQRGEFRSVPDACHVVSAVVLTEDLAGVSTRKVIQPFAGGGLSQCSFTVDARPVFRVLQVTLQAYQPSLLAPGNGSATANATYNYFQAQQALTSPPKKSDLPRAAVSPLTGLGQAAFSAVQVIRTGGDVSDLVTVVARARNTLITITLQGLDKARKGGYGPVSVRALQAGALAAAREVLPRVSAEPTAR